MWFTLSHSSEGSLASVCRWLANGANVSRWRRRCSNNAKRRLSSPVACAACSRAAGRCWSSSSTWRTPSTRQRQTGSRRSQTGPWRWCRRRGAARSWPRCSALSWSARWWYLAGSNVVSVLAMDTGFKCDYGVLLKLLKGMDWQRCVWTIHTHTYRLFWVLNQPGNWTVVGEETLWHDVLLKKPCKWFLGTELAEASAGFLPCCIWCVVSLFLFFSLRNFHFDIPEHAPKLTHFCKHVRAANHLSDKEIKTRAAPEHHLEVK